MLAFIAPLLLSVGCVLAQNTTQVLYLQQDARVHLYLPSFRAQAFIGGHVHSKQHRQIAACVYQLQCGVQGAADCSILAPCQSLAQLTALQGGPPNDTLYAEAIAVCGGDMLSTLFPLVRVLLCLLD